MGIDIQVVAPRAGAQCYYIRFDSQKIAETAHRLANDGVAEYCSRKPGPIRWTRPSSRCKSPRDRDRARLDYIMKTNLKIERASRS